jgi:hypothetical protein
LKRNGYTLLALLPDFRASGGEVGVRVIQIIELVQYFALPLIMHF